MTILVRQAVLQDAGAVQAVYCSQVKRWMRFMPDGTHAEAAYAELSLYERWLHGGPWMSVETCAVWLAHLLQASEGIPLVAEREGQVVGYAEVFIGREAPPYGYHVNISTLCVREEARRQGVGRALVGYIEQMAQVLGCERVTVAYPDETAFYSALGFTPLVGRYRVKLPLEQGRVFYKAREVTDENPQQIRDWYMPLGRFQNGREEWERMRWSMWNAVPQLVEANWHRLFIDLTGQPGILHLHQRDDDPTLVTVRLWTRFPLSSHILSAVRDRASRLGYAQMVTLVDAEARALLGGESSGAEEVQWLYAKNC